MKITILDDYQDIVRQLACYSILNNQNVQILNYTEKNTKLLAQKLNDTNILVLTRERTEVNEELLIMLPNLKLISQTGKVSNHLDLQACTKFKVAVAEGIGSPIAPSELAWALLMNTVRQIPQSIEAMKNGNWQNNVGTGILGKTIGIWGYGKIGQRIAQFAKVFGARVIIWGSEESREKGAKDGFEKADTKEMFFKSADIVTLHLRLNENTIGIVKGTDLMNMKTNSTLINTARAELIEKGALLKSLKKGKPTYAGIDVYESEPIYDKQYELLSIPNVVCTPHLGYVEQNSYELYFGKAFENVINFLSGNPTNIINPEVL